MSEIIIKSGAYAESISNSAAAKVLKRSGGFSLTKAVLDILAASTCCTKDITASEITATTSVTTDLISEYTAANGVTIDGVKLKDGGVTANSMYAGFYPTAAPQSLSGAGAVNVTSYLTNFTSTGGAQALTLANGTQIGQLKKIHHIVDGGSGILTPASLSGGTTVTFTTVGEFALLIWSGTAWSVIELGNTASATLPVLA
jgi:hypothetical protein